MAHVNQILSKLIYILIINLLFCNRDILLSSDHKYCVPYLKHPLHLHPNIKKQGKSCLVTLQSDQESWLLGTYFTLVLENLCQGLSLWLPN